MKLNRFSIDSESEAIAVTDKIHKETRYSLLRHVRNIKDVMTIFMTIQLENEMALFLIVLKLSA